jgi:hypothetical protein
MDDYRTFDVGNIYGLDKRTIEVLMDEGIIRQCRKCSTWDSPDFHIEGTLPFPEDIPQADDEDPEEVFVITEEILSWALKLAKKLQARSANLEEVY